MQEGYLQREERSYKGCGRCACSLPGSWREAEVGGGGTTQGERLNCQSQSDQTARLRINEKREKRNIKQNKPLLANLPVGAESLARCCNGMTEGKQWDSDSDTDTVWLRNNNSPLRYLGDFGWPWCG